MKVSDAFKKAFRGEEVEPSTPDTGEITPTISKMLLLTQDGCHGCDLAKEYLKEEIGDGSVEVCPLEDGRCNKIANELHLRETPSIVSIDGDGMRHKCDIRTDGDDFMIECPVSNGENGRGEPDKEEVVEKRPPKHGKVAIACMSPSLKQDLGWKLQSEHNVSPEVLAQLSAIPECADQEDGMPQPIGLGEIKGGSKAHHKTTGRNKFMRECLSGKTGEAQPLRMSRCSREWREKSDKEKKQYG